MNGAGGNFGGDGYVHGLDCGDGFTDVYSPPNSSTYKCIQLFGC